MPDKVFFIKSDFGRGEFVGGGWGLDIIGGTLV